MYFSQLVEIGHVPKVKPLKWICTFNVLKQRLQILHLRRKLNRHTQSSCSIEERELEENVGDLNYFPKDHLRPLVTPNMGRLWYIAHM